MPGEITVSADSKAELRQLLDRITVEDGDSIEVAVRPSPDRGEPDVDYSASDAAPPTDTNKARVIQALDPAEYRTADEIAELTGFDVQTARNTLPGLRDSRLGYNLAEKRKAPEDKRARVEYRLSPLGAEVKRYLSDQQDE